MWIILFIFAYATMQGSGLYGPGFLFFYVFCFLERPHRPAFPENYRIMAKETIYLTAEGYKKLKDELDHMRSVERPAISAAIAEARDKGDLSENAEYDAAREAQGLLEMRKKGAYTIGQDKESCVVYGMPMVAQNIGAVMQQAPCENIANVLVRHLSNSHM